MKTEGIPAALCIQSTGKSLPNERNVFKGSTLKCEAKIQQRRELAVSLIAYNQLTCYGHIKKW
jgi:hypothetical protein